MSTVRSKAWVLLDIREDVMKDLCLKPGQTVSDEKIKEIVLENKSRELAEFIINRIRKKLMENKWLTREEFEKLNGTGLYMSNANFYPRVVMVKILIMCQLKSLSVQRRLNE